MSTSSRAPRSRLSVECLEDRTTPAVAAFFAAGVLSVFGDGNANAIAVKADADGTLRVTNNGNAVNVRSFSGPANRAALQAVFVDGGAGNDTITTDASLNTLDAAGLAASPAGVLLGGGGNDTITVGHGGIVGGLAGVTNGVVTGKVVGNCVIDGGAGNDTLNSGFGNDIMFGGAGDDTYVWLPGTLTDRWDGGSGNDTVIVVGNDTSGGAPAGDAFSLTADGSRVRFKRTNLVQFDVDIGTTERIILRPGAGNDSVFVGDLTGVASLRSVAVEGAAGDDLLDASAQVSTGVAVTLTGGAGADTFKPGPNGSVTDLNPADGDVLGSP